MRKASSALLLGSLSAAALAATDAIPPLQDAMAEYARLAAAPQAGRCEAAATLVLPVALSAGATVDASFDGALSRLRVLYRMGFNQLTEGWNWHPLAPAEGGDYYRYKFLPLASTTEERGSYQGEDKIGTAQEFRVRWRYDYFFAFDNPYDFYPRADDDAGFVADIALPAQEAERLMGGDLRMALRGHLKPDCLSDSTTFWKATSAQPVDFTLKKRYLIGTLAEVWFYDAKTGRILARMARAATRRKD